MDRLTRSSSARMSRKTKRRRTASPSPRRAVIRNKTRVSQEGKDGLVVTENHKTKDKEKNKRRSSMRRRSLVATLQCIQSKRADESEKNGGNKANSEVVEEPSTCPADKGRSTYSADSVEIGTGESAGAAASSVGITREITLSEASKPVSNSDVLCDNQSIENIRRLKAECDGWTKQVEKYKHLGNVTPSFKVSTTLDTNRINAKYDYWDEQVCVLEETLAASITVVSKTMDRINDLNSYHKIRVKKVAENIFDGVMQDRGERDPRLLMKKIFMLHSMKHKV